MTAGGGARLAPPPLRHHDDLRAVITHFCGQEQHAVQRQLNADRFRLATVLALVALAGALTQLTGLGALGTFVAALAILFAFYLETIFRFRANACRLIIFHVQRQSIEALNDFNYGCTDADALRLPGRQQSYAQARRTTVDYSTNDDLYAHFTKEARWFCARIDELTLAAAVPGLGLFTVLVTRLTSVYDACVDRDAANCELVVWAHWWQGLTGAQYQASCAATQCLREPGALGCLTF